MNPKLEQMLAELARTGFYGKVEIEFQSGKAVLVRKTQSYKLYEESSNGPRKETRDR